MTVVVTHYRVKGADGRLVGTYSATEFEAFKTRIRHAVQHGHHRPRDEAAHGDRGPATIAAERFVILPLNVDGVVCGPAERWQAEG